MSEPNIHVPFARSYWVVPNLFLAGEHPGDADVAAAKRTLTSLLDAGIRTFVDLTEEDEINEDAKPVPGYRPVLRTLTEEQKTEITYVRVPVPDRGVPSVWSVRRILDVTDRSIADENPVFVHCWAGRGRTGTIVGCYLKRHGLATDEAVIQKIAELRRRMPNASDTSPHTPGQIRMVKGWKKGA